MLRARIRPEAFLADDDTFSFSIVVVIGSTSPKIPRERANEELEAGNDGGSNLVIKFYH